MHLELTRLWAWCHQCACCNGDILRSRGANLADVLREFCVTVIHVLDFVRSETFCPVGENILVYRTRGEVDYLEPLRAIPTERLEA